MRPGLTFPRFIPFLPPYPCALAGSVPPRAFKLSHLFKEVAP